ncbi:hypothetical protein JKP88DRAFT_200130 [Tribonema minus]|uniref:Cytochrome b5 heme-binding domain-containing protein n=1 Tax=Tribonema minus TaxID=303371 RepID=A0A836CD55_9STRA|nr:hypothetical protein JKP88DRAFT_200130 [Tribonema minus]
MPDPAPTLLCLCMQGYVFDVSSDPGVYGEGGRYHFLTRHDASYCLATGSCDAADLDREDLSCLTPQQQRTLSGWVEMLQAKGCAVLGRLVRTPPPKPFQRHELRHFNGRQSQVPAGYAIPPMYMACNGVVFDVSFGGLDMYDVGCPYACLVGNDASCVLARMSMTQADIDGTLDMANLSEKEQRNLTAWEAKLRQKGYPVVGYMRAE